MKADGNTHLFDQAIAEELNKVGAEIECKRYPHERNDEFGYRMLAEIEDALDSHESAIAELEWLYQTVKALL